METKILRIINNAMIILKKILTCFIIIVTVIMSLGIFIFKDFRIGYRYIELNRITNAEKIIGYSKNNIDIFYIIDEYLKYLEDDGYYIASYDIKNFIYKECCIIPKEENKISIINKIINSLQVNVFCKELIINNNSLYFKNNNDMELFLNKVKEIDNIDYIKKEKIINIKYISSTKIINNEIENIKKNKETKYKMQEQQKNNIKVTSRGNTDRKSTSSTLPLKKYTYISSGFGMRCGTMHSGIDFAASLGTPIYAYKSGVVEFAGFGIKGSGYGGYGNVVKINHENGIETVYGHCSKLNVKTGQIVNVGDIIGNVGSTGNSTGNHLHFEIRINGIKVNPNKYLNIK